MLSLSVIAACLPTRAHAQTAPLGGFIPFVGIQMTNDFKNSSTDLTGTFFIADARTSMTGTPLRSANGSLYYDLALLDTGAATHILTQQAAGPSGFNISGNGFGGTNIQPIGGATGIINLSINDPAGIFAGGLAGAASSNNRLTMNPAPARGQTSVATLSAPSQWQLPNILGLPMAAQHGIVIRNDQPVVFEHQGRTVRTPQVDFIERGSGADEGIVRRTDLKIRPGAAFVAGPLYIQNFDLLGGNFVFHDNPLSPTVVENAGLFIEVDLSNGDPIFPGVNIREHEMHDVEFLFDTGADLTVVSGLMAKRLGFDPLVDEPDFVLQVEGSGGVADGVPGFYVEQLNIDTVGGNFTMQHVPIAVLDVTNPNDPGNIIPGILGMHLFTGRNLVIDANPSIGQGGAGPSLYISDPVTTRHTWAATTATANWSTAGSWAAEGTPGSLWVAEARNAIAGDQRAVISADSMVSQLIVGGDQGRTMTVEIAAAAKLTTVGETRIDPGGRIHLAGGKLDVQFINMDGGVLSGSGEVFAGTGPITGAIRNHAGRIEPGAGIGVLEVIGDVASLEPATMAFELGGTTAGTLHDQLQVDRFAFLGGALEVTLVDAGGGLFQPAVGNTFTLITAGEGVEGEFDSLLLPAGYTWDVDYLPTSVVLEVTGIGSLAGDFNSDGQVSAADLAQWGQQFGATGMHGGKFLEWQRGFAPSGATLAVVPEPTAIALAGLMVLAAGRLPRRHLMPRSSECHFPRGGRETSHLPGCPGCPGGEIRFPGSTAPWDLLILHSFGLERADRADGGVPREAWSE
jgi:hypothetical protein